MVKAATVAAESGGDGVTKREERAMAEEPYRVEVDNNGCKRCCRGKTWTVLGPDDVACGTSWDYQEGADSYASDMNAAYWAGKGE